MVNKKYKRTNTYGLGGQIKSQFKSGGLNSLVGSAGNAVSSGISGGLQSKAGNALNGLGDVASAIPGPWGAVASAALKTAGGLFNRMFGSQINEEAVANFKTENAAASNQSFNAATTEDLMNQNLRLLGSINKDEVGKDGWFSHTVADLTKDLNDKRIMANNQAVGNFNAAANSVDTNNDFMALGNYSAFGGPLSTNGGIFSNGLMMIDNGGTHEENPFQGVPMGVDDEGVPNLVEEGETIFNDYVFSKRLMVPKAIRKKYKLKDNISFADASKKLSKESEERPNDPISERGLMAMMSDLASTQEQLKMEESQKEGMNNRFDEGGGIKRYKGLGKSYNRGWFGADGKYTKEYLDRVNGMTIPQLQAQFDSQKAFYDDENNRGTDRWKSIDNFYRMNPKYNQTGYKVTDKDLAFAKRGAQDYNPGYLHDLAVSATGLDIPNEDLPPLQFRQAPPLEGQMYPIGIPSLAIPDDADLPPLEFRGPDTELKGQMVGMKAPELLPTSTTPISEKEPQWKQGKYADWLRYAPAVGLGISSILDLAGVTNKPDYSNADAVLEATRDAGTYQPVKFNPIGDYMTYNPFDRNFYSNKLEAQTGATKRAIINQSAGNRATAVAGLLAADYNAQSQMGDLYRKAEEYNLDQRHKVQDFNRTTNITNSQGTLQADLANQRALAESKGARLRGTMAAAEMRERARLAADQAKSANISGLFQTLGDIGFEERNARMRDWGIKHDIYGPGTQDYGRFRRNAKGGKLKKKGLTF